MGKKVKKRDLKRCVATGKIINGHEVIIADTKIIIDYLAQLGYTVLLSPERFFSKIGKGIIGGTEQ